MWTPDKKIGDSVAYSTGGFFSETKVFRVTKVTSTQIELDDPHKTRIVKRTGKLVGSSTRYAKDVTDELLAQVAYSEKWSRISREATKIKDQINELYLWGDKGREWLVKHVGPLLPKEGE